MYNSVAPMPPIDIAIVHSKRGVAKAMSEFGIKKRPRDVEATNVATTYALENTDTGECVFVVYISPKSVEWSASQDIGTITLEASHIARTYFESLREASPSNELQAYTVAHIASELFGEHFDWKRKKMERESK